MPSVQVPSVRTIVRILERAGEVAPRRKRDRFSVPEHARMVEASEPHDLWTVDFKGWWLTGDKSRADPLTVRDAASRFVLCAQLMSETGALPDRVEFERLFELHGLPAAIQMDKGSPVACTRARGTDEAISLVAEPTAIASLDAVRAASKLLATSGSSTGDAVVVGGSYAASVYDERQ